MSRKYRFVSEQAAEEPAEQIVPRDSRLFVSCFNNEWYSYGSGQAYKIDPSNLTILDRRPCPFLSDFAKPFNHFYQCVQF